MTGLKTGKHIAEIATCYFGPKVRIPAELFRIW
jgi:hypothetical protein